MAAWLLLYLTYPGNQPMKKDAKLKRHYRWHKACCVPGHPGAPTTTFEGRKTRMAAPLNFSRWFGPACQREEPTLGFHCFIVFLGSMIGTSKVAGATWSFFHSVKEMVILALPLTASSGTRTGPSKVNGGHLSNGSLMLIRFGLPSLQ